MNYQGPKTPKDKGLKGCKVGTSARIHEDLMHVPFDQKANN